MTNPISGDGTRKIKIDIGTINCLNEPYAIDLNGTKIILRYKCSGDDHDFGEITLEATAD